MALAYRLWVQTTSWIARAAAIASGLMILFLSARAWAGACPVTEWKGRAGIPECPSSGSTILPANFPNAAFVVSDDQNLEHGLKKPPAAQVFTETVVLEILKNSGDRVPTIFLPVKPATYDRVRAAISDFARKNPSYASQEQLWLSAVVKSNDPPFAWQQDYFKAFVDPSTGSPVLRQVEDYEYSGVLVDDLAKEIQASCPMISQGPKLKSIGIPADTPKGGLNGFDGGNIAGLPGGLCLHGDNQNSEFAGQYCGSKDNEVTIAVSWLVLGHIDEVFGLVGNPRAAAPCNFAVTLASPRLALKLLKASSKEKFFHFYADGGHARTDLSYRAYDRNGSGAVCDLVSTTLAKKGPSRLSRRLAGRDCLAITNGDVAKAYGSGDLGILNELIQAKMNEARTRIVAKIRQRLPQCEIPVIEIPQLFQGGSPRKVGRHYELPDAAMVSLLPNGTNTLVVGNGTVLSPHPQNDAFARAMDRSYAKVGIKNRFVDTYDYAHIMGGNLHCVTQSVPLCKAGNGTSH